MGLIFCAHSQSNNSLSLLAISTEHSKSARVLPVVTSNFRSHRFDWCKRPNPNRILVNYYSTTLKFE